MTYTQPVEEHERELAEMPADASRWLGRLVWIAVWLSGGMFWAWMIWMVWG